MTINTEKTGPVLIADAPARNPPADMPDKGAMGTLWALGAMTVLGTLAVISPYMLSGFTAVAASFVIALLLFGTAWLVWWRLSHPRGVDYSRQEVLLREAFHSVLTPQIITDTAGNLLLANRAFRGWIDLGSQNAEQALAARFSASPTVTAEFQQVKASLQKGQPGIAELPIMRGGKVVEWRRIVSRPIEGFADVYHWRFEDISERRRMEKAMRDEQNKLLDFMAHAPVGIYSVDQHGRFRFVNRTLAEWLQVTPEELVKG